MAFRDRNKGKGFILMGGWSAFEDVDEVDELGRTTHKRISPHVEKLPPVENFELETLLKSGVPLQQVRTKIFAPDVSPILDSMAEATEKDFAAALERNKQTSTT